MQRALQTELAGLEGLRSVGARDLQDIQREVEGRLTDWRGLLRRQIAQSRQILRKLLVGRIVSHYLAGRSGVRGNGTQAAIAAGYAPRSAAVQAHALLRRPRIQQALAARCAKADITADRVLEKLRRVAFSDMGDVADWNADGVRVIPHDQLSEDARRTLDEIVEHTTRRITTRRTKAHGKPGEPGFVPEGEVETVTEERQTRVKLHDKIAALVTLSKYLGLLKDRSDEPERPLFPKGFFEAKVLGHVNRIKGFLPEDTVLETTATPGTPNQAQYAKPRSSTSLDGTSDYCFGGRTGFGFA